MQLGNQMFDLRNELDVECMLKTKPLPPRIAVNLNTISSRQRVRIIHPGITSLLIRDHRPKLARKHHMKPATREKFWRLALDLTRLEDLKVYSARKNLYLFSHLYRARFASTLRKLFLGQITSEVPRITLLMKNLPDFYNLETFGIDGVFIRSQESLLLRVAVVICELPTLEEAEIPLLPEPCLMLLCSARNKGALNRIRSLKVTDERILLVLRLVTKLPSFARLDRVFFGGSEFISLPRQTFFKKIGIYLNYDHTQFNFG